MSRCHCLAWGQMGHSLQAAGLPVMRAQAELGGSDMLHQQRPAVRNVLIHLGHVS